MFIIVRQWETSTSVWIQESFVPPRPSLDPSTDNSSTARIGVIPKYYKPQTSESNLCDSGNSMLALKRQLTSWDVPSCECIGNVKDQEVSCNAFFQQMVRV